MVGRRDHWHAAMSLDALLIGVLGFGAVVSILYVGFYYLSQFLMLLGAWIEVRRQRRQRHFWQPLQVASSHSLPGITVLVPAYNETAVIERTVRSILTSVYPELEVLVINDGSRDATLELLIDKFELQPVEENHETPLITQPVRQIYRCPQDARLRVIDKHNGGKADALNVGLNHAAQALICAVDADVLLDRWALFHLVRPFLDHQETVATSGVIRLQNGCVLDHGRVTENRLPRSWIESLQALEYLRAFSIGRLFFNLVQGHLIISGAFGLFRRSLLYDIGGYQAFAIGEDMELVMRIHRHLLTAGRPYRVELVADAKCYTEAPTRVGELGRQRTRWHQGLLTTLRLHKDMIASRRFGRIGRLFLPYFLLFELLAPVVELFGWVMLPVSWAAGWVPFEALMFFLILTVIIGIANSFAAIAIDSLEIGTFRRASDRLRLLGAALIEPLGYHQLTLIFRCRAFPRYYGQIHLGRGWRPPERRTLPQPTPEA